MNDREKLVAQRMAAIERGPKSAQLAMINYVYMPDIKRRMLGTLGMKDYAARLRTLYEAIAPAARAVASLAACRKGCAHCCHIAVAINQAEAQIIGEATGLQPATPTRNRKLQKRDEFAAELPLGYGNPCPFLKDNECSIYEARPLACRTHFNLDVDAELCRLDYGNNPLPMWHTIQIDTMAVTAAGGPDRVVLADIREFFPPSVVKDKTAET